MKRRARPRARTLVIDVGGSNIKCVASDHRRRIKFSSGPRMTPGRMVEKILELTAHWRFDQVAIGYPGVVLKGRIAREPHNLGKGWVDFDFRAAFRRPVRIINDAAMQALGAYDGGKMLFLGLGTGLGSTLIVEGVIVPMELGHLPCSGRRTWEHFLGDQGRKRLKKKKWLSRVQDAVEEFREALLPDYIVLGGGNASRVKRLPSRTRRGKNADAFTGGFRLWEHKADR